MKYRDEIDSLYYLGDEWQTYRKQYLEEQEEMHRRIRGYYDDREFFGGNSFDPEPVYQSVGIFGEAVVKMGIDSNGDFQAIQVDVHGHTAYKQAFRDACSFLSQVDPEAIKRLMKKYPEYFLDKD